MGSDSTSRRTDAPRARPGSYAARARHVWSRHGATLCLLALVGIAAHRLGRAPAPIGHAVGCSSPVQIDGRLSCSAQLAAQLHAAPGDAVELSSGTHGRMPPRWLGALDIQLDLNRAPVGELTSIHGVGPVLAERIAQGRPYATVQDVERVRGVGPTKRRAIEARVFVEP